MEDALRVYRSFPRQQDAMNFAAQCNMDILENKPSLIREEADVVKVQNASKILLRSKIECLSISV